MSTIRVGEESGQLDNMLDSIANALEEEAENATKRIVTLLEPILICIMACIVGFNYGCCPDANLSVLCGHRGSGIKSAVKEKT